MTTFRPDTSFPFLAIARAYSMPYAQVLEIAEHFERGGIHTGGSLVMAQIADAVASETKRRRLNKSGKPPG